MTLNITQINRVVRQIGFADESQYFIQVDGHANDAIIVESVKVEHWSITGIDYRLRVKVLTTQVLDGQNLLNKKAVIKFLWRGALAPVVGEIQRVSEANGNNNFNGYFLTMVSPLAVLRLRSENRVFLKQSSLEVAKDLLAEFSAGRFAINVHAVEPATRAMMVQYQQSDWDFIERILLRDGIMVHIHQGEEQVEVYLTDDVAQLPMASMPLVLPFRDAIGAAADEEYVALLRQQSQVIPQSVQVFDFQAHQTLDVKAEAETGQNSLYQDYRWGENYSDETAKAQAGLISRAYQSTEQTLYMQTNCRGLRPGMALTLTGHNQWSGEYLVLEVECEGQQFSGNSSTAAGASKAFLNSIIAIPAGKPYIPLLPRRSQIASTLTATIAAEVDEAGYYQVRLPFDSAAAGDHTSIPTRMVQPFGGQDHGMHFPLTVDTEVVIGFENGDIDRPIILGATHNDRTPSVVTQDNAYQNLIRTRGNNELLLDDTPQQTRIQLNTAEQKNRVQLSAKTDQHMVELCSEEGDVVLQAGKNLSLESGGDMSVSVGANQEITVAGDLKVMTEDGDIVHQAGASVQMTATENIEWISDEGDITLDVGGHWVVEAAEGSSTHVVSGDQQVVIEDGSFRVEAGTDIVLSAGNEIILTQGSASIVIDSSGNLTLDASKVDITADKIAIKGGSVSNN